MLSREQFTKTQDAAAAAKTTELTRVVMELMNLADLAFSQDPVAIHQLHDTLRSIRQEAMALAQPSQLPNEVYGRRVLCAFPSNEIMIARWRPRSACAPHDHGRSLGRVIAVDGEFLETSYRFDPSNGLTATGQERVASPHLMTVDDGALHSMQCLSETGGVTLHFYRPAVRDMRVFDAKNRRTYVVSEDCGAWMPSIHQIQSTELWQTL